MDSSFAQHAERPRAPAAAKALLSQCKAMACSKLSAIVAEALEKVENDLFTMAAECASPAEQQILLEAMAQLREHRAEIQKTFDRCFAELYEQRVNGTPASSTSQELSLENLQLVDENEMEESLTISELARKTKNRIDPDQLLGIQVRFGHLLARENLDDEGNPLAPEAVFKALKQACARIPGSFAVKRSLLTAVQPYIASGMDTVYADVNRNLISHHVVPRIKHRVQRAADKPVGGAPAGGGLSQMLANQPLHTSQVMPLSQLAPAGGMPLNPAMAMTAPLDLSALLAAVMNGPGAARQHAAMMFADPAAYKLDKVMETPASPELLASLSSLQANMSMTGNFAPGNLLAGLDQQVKSRSHPLDQLTIELVTMVFDYILNDSDVPDTVKAEIARLQIVAVKAALLDRTFFARRQHPMRRLLDRIAEAGQDPDIDTGADSEFIHGLRAIANQAINAFDDDLAIFETALEQLEQLVNQVTQAQRSKVETATLKLAREELTQMAEAEARAALHRYVSRRTPAFVRDFLYTWWTQVLAHARVAENEAQWQEALEIAEALTWSVSPLRSTDVQRLAALLPQLMRGLMYGMNVVAMPPEAREAFFNRLMETHTAAVHAAKAARTPEPEPADDAEGEWAGQPETPATPEAAALLDGDDLLLHTVRSLERGALVDFYDDGEDAPPKRCKLSWISPKQTVLLFTSSAHGARKYTAEELVAWLRDGKARLVEDMQALIDRAVGAIVAESEAS
ncbi:MAG: DUF1631 family protein [Pseudomonadota bacterium]|nr:MAG: hypothetical protein DIU74_00010 [Pseudomonadota bacterium]